MCIVRRSATVYWLAVATVEPFGIYMLHTQERPHPRAKAKAKAQTAAAKAKAKGKSKAKAKSKADSERSESAEPSNVGQVPGVKPKRAPTAKARAKAEARDKQAAEFSVDESGPETYLGGKPKNAAKAKAGKLAGEEDSDSDNGPAGYLARGRSKAKAGKKAVETDEGPQAASAERDSDMEKPTENTRPRAKPAAKPDNPKRRRPKQKSKSETETESDLEPDLPSDESDVPSAPATRRGRKRPPPDASASDNAESDEPMQEQRDDDSDSDHDDESDSDSSSSSDSEGSEGSVGNESGEDHDIQRVTGAHYPVITAYKDDEDVTDDIKTHHDAHRLVVHWDEATSGACLVNHYEVRIGSVVQCLEDKGDDEWESWLVVVCKIPRVKRRRGQYSIIGRDLWYVKHARAEGLDEDENELETGRWEPIDIPMLASDANVPQRPMPPVDDRDVDDWCAVLDVNFRMTDTSDPSDTKKPGVGQRTIDVKNIRKVIPVYRSMAAAEQAWLAGIHHPVRPYAVPPTFMMDSKRTTKGAKFHPFRNDRTTSTYVTYEVDLPMPQEEEQQQQQDLEMLDN